MNIHEYQAKELLSRYGVPVTNGFVATFPQEAIEAAKKLSSDGWVVKAQIHAGGRGRGGGIKFAKNIDEVAQETRRLIGSQLITPETSLKGQRVNKVYIQQSYAVKRELYVALLIDRTTGRITVMASTQGGIEIETLAKDTPEKIIKLVIDPLTGLQPFHARKIAVGLNLKNDEIPFCEVFLKSLYTAFVNLDCTVIEINPLAVLENDHVVCLDAKMSLDDNALFRHPEFLSLRDEAEENSIETQALKDNLNYVKLEGSIGCMVNGAGLAMATMDLIKLHGEEPANFLDVGGGATKDRVKAAFKIIVNDPAVKGILVNIFGGIMRCDIIAEGIVDAAREIDLQVPLVVRLEGTNVDLGKQILNESGLNILSASDLEDATTKIVHAVRGVA